MAWLFFPSSFVSVVGDTTYPGRVLVRARVREHIEALAKKHPDILGDVPIERRHGDYAWAVRVPVEVAGEMARREIIAASGYPNFKNEAARLGRHGSPYVAALHRVWSVMVGLQRADDERHSEIEL